MFPASNGLIRSPTGLQRAWKVCLTRAGVEERFTVHGLRYTFTDLVRRAKVDAVVRRALTGHVTEQMQRHYSSVGLDEKRTALATVHSMVSISRPEVGPLVGPEAENGDGRSSGGLNRP
jgi:integrase